MTMDEHIGAIVEAAVRRALDETAPQKDVEPLWDTEKVSTYLGITPRSVANLRAKGLPWRRIGDAVRFDKSEVDAWSREQARGSHG